MVGLLITSGRGRESEKLDNRLFNLFVGKLPVLSPLLAAILVIDPQHDQ